jgi:GNAT superfamily N-acetyltransferase
MDFFTIDYWDEQTWSDVETVYQQAFPEHGRKTTAIIRKMFEKKLCFLHGLRDQSGVIAMALTGKLDGVNVLLIDYLAVHYKKRNKGIGQTLMNDIKEWAKNECRYDGIIIEVECEPTETNHKRILFWEKCGFHLVTDYTHHYIWVPEPYQAMYLTFSESKPFPSDGKTLFQSITNFHRKAYRGK